MIRNFFMALALLLTTVSCNHSMLGQASSTNQGKLSYLFVIMSNYGVLQQAPDGSYQLTLDHGDVEKVLAFSNRPHRIVKHETGKALKNIWSQGSNSFADDPPNATLIINQHLQTVILTSMNLQGDKTVFTIEPDSSSSLTPISGSCQLFMDSDALGCSFFGTCTNGT